MLWISFVSFVLSYDVDENRCGWGTLLHHVDHDDHDRRSNLNCREILYFKY